MVSDHYHGKLKEWVPGSGIRLIGPSSNNGNAVDAQGRLVSCVPKHKHVVRREPDGRLTVLADTYQGKKFNSPNDLAVHSDGSVWFTDPCWFKGRNNQPKNRVYRIDPETKEVAAVTESCVLPNGICFSPDEKLMYIADTARGIWVFSVEGKGVKGKGRILKWRSSLATPDGIKCDKAGNIFMNGNEGTGIYAPDNGKLLGVINTPEPSINHCFGGPDRDTLFIATKAGLYRIDLRKQKTDDRRQKAEDR